MKNIIKSDNEAKQLGFIDVHEMQLYHDVCCNENVSPETLEELLLQLQSECDVISSKKDFEEYIEENNLLELLERVKELSDLDRMIQIYLYNANGLSISKFLEENLQKKIQDAKELFDGEKEMEYSSQLQHLRSSHQKYFDGMHYIQNQAFTRLPQRELAIFLDNINYVTSSILSDSSGGKKKK